MRPSLKPPLRPVAATAQAEGALACGAQNREGRPCSNKALNGKRRCRFHGGLSTGPRTPEGRARIAAGQRRRWGKTLAPAPVDPYRDVGYETTGASFMSI